MPRYLWKVRYTPEGASGLAKEGGNARKSAVEKMLGSMGGRLEAIYWAFGEDDAYVIAEVPDNVTAAAAALTVSGSGAVGVTTTVLLTADEVDQVSHKTIDYTPPGS